MEASPAAIGRFFSERPRLGDLLVRKGFIKPEQLTQALVEARSSGELLGRVLIRERMIFEDELSRSLAEQLALPYVNLGVLGLDAGAARMLPPAEGRRAGASPGGMIGGRVRCAFADPWDGTATATFWHYV